MQTVRAANNTKRFPKAIKGGSKPTKTSQPKSNEKPFDFTFAATGNSSGSKPSPSMDDLRAAVRRLSISEGGKYCYLVKKLSIHWKKCSKVSLIRALFYFLKQVSQTSFANLFRKLASSVCKDGIVSVSIQLDFFRNILDFELLFKVCLELQNRKFFCLFYVI